MDIILIPSKNILSRGVKSIERVVKNDIPSFLRTASVNSQRLSSSTSEASHYNDVLTWTPITSMSAHLPAPISSHAYS
jgi:hypothetical protein